jgi:Fe-S cluster assembly ATP-binding protein
MALLSIKNLWVSGGDREIVRGVNLELGKGEVHAIMGPNGSGKSTLVNVLMGHPAYSITKGTVLYDGKDLLKMETHERAQAGLFLAFQYPKDIAGVTLQSFLFAAYKVQMAARFPDRKIFNPFRFRQFLEEKMNALHIDPTFADRFVNKGFSGGEKKKAEILQMHVLEPTLALLDETDSGLDVDALKTVAEGINAVRSPDISALVVTHYARILDYITPDHVHVMVAGNIVESGGAELARVLEKKGYASYGSSRSIALG